VLAMDHCPYSSTGGAPVWWLTSAHVMTERSRSRLPSRWGRCLGAGRISQLRCHCACALAVHCVHCVHRSSGSTRSTPLPMMSDAGVRKTRSGRVRRQGLEPRTRGLREDRSAAPSALPAQMAPLERPECTQCTTISRWSFHESFHGTRVRLRQSVTERSRGAGLATSPQRSRRLRLVTGLPVAFRPAAWVAGTGRASAQSPAGRMHGACKWTILGL
jgi:hypothetical protein